LTSAASLSTQFYRLGPVRKIERWLNAMPHPSMVVEIASNHVAAARWGGSRGHLESYAIEPLPSGAVMPSPVDANIPQPDTVKSALRRVFSRVPHHGGQLALLIPDPVVRVFILQFETLPRRADEALPLLRWRLKKSVPFDVDETVVSWMRQESKTEKLDVVTAVARQRIVREYEGIIESFGATPGVVLSSTLAALPLLEDRGATLLVRMSGRTLTTVIVRLGNLVVYRSSELARDALSLDPRLVLDEIFPAIAYYQDTWGGSPERACLSGFGSQHEAFSRALSQELNVSAAPLSASAESARLPANVQDLVRQESDGLVGWMLNRGS